MKKKNKEKPWAFLDEYRGMFFDGRWPSIPQLFNITVSRYPERKCWECFYPNHELFTFSQAKEAVDVVSRYLYSIGVRKGDRVALTGKNSPQWAIAYMGIIGISAIVVPTDYSLSDEEIEHLVDFVEIKGIFTDAERIDRLGKDNKYQFKIALEDVCNLPDPGPVSFEIPRASDMAAFLFTSGTTGTPKACMLTHENFVSDIFLAQGNLRIYCTDVFYAILPIHHAYTMLAVFLESIGVGAEVIFGKRLVISQMFKEMRQGKITMFLSVPMIFNKLLSGIMKQVEERGVLASLFIKSLATVSGLTKKIFGINPGKKMFGFLLDKIALKDIRICICGGGPLPPATFKKLNEFGIDFVQGYGLTETSPIVVLNPLNDYNENSIGKPIPEVQIKIDSPDSEGNGEILIKGSMVFGGYYKNQEATDSMIDSEGWLHSGDVGHIDKNEFVYLTGRAKNIIVSEGGKNIFPEEIEDHFQLYYDVEQICVLGYIVDKEKKAEAVCALIHPSAECLRNYPDRDCRVKHIEEIVQEVNKNLLPYKRIRKTIVLDEEMEQTSTKKIKRFVVSQKYRTLIND